MRLVSVIVLDCPGLDGLPPRDHHAWKQAETEWIYVRPMEWHTTEATSVLSNVWQIEVPESLDYGLDRVIGASFAHGDGLVFVKFTSVLEWDPLRPFAEGIRQGAALVLRRGVDVDTPPGVATPEHYPAQRLAARALNRLLSRDDLGFATADEFPHAVSRPFLNHVGLGSLQSPPKLSVHAVAKGFAIETVCLPEQGTAIPDVNLEFVLKNYLEAVAELVQYRGRRAGYTDFERRRDVASLVRGNGEELHRVLR